MTKSNKGIKRINVFGKFYQFDTNNIVLYSDDAPTPYCKPEQQKKHSPINNGPRAMVLNVTHQCNLACKYCFVRNYYPDQLPRMSIETAIKGLGMFQKPVAGRYIGENSYALSFFGGEPLMEWELIKQTTLTFEQMCKFAGAQGRVHITTNGTLLDDEKMQFISSHGFSLIVSCDGPAHLHDDMRPHRDGKGSHSEVLRALTLVAKYPNVAKRTTIRGTFTAKNINLLERLKHNNELMMLGCAQNVSVEPASIMSEGCACLKDGHELSFTSKHYKEVKREYKECADYQIEQIKSGKPKLSWAQVDKMVNRILKRQATCNECGAGNGYWTIGPKGDIYPCHREGEPIGHVDSGIDEEKRWQWLDNRRYTHPHCNNCWARNVCGGGCRKDAQDATGSIFGQNKMACAVRKIWIKCAIHIITNIGNELAVRHFAPELLKKNSQSCKR